MANYLFSVYVPMTAKLRLIRTKFTDGIWQTIGTFSLQKNFQQVLDLLQAGVTEVERLIGKTSNLTDFPQVLQMLLDATHIISDAGTDGEPAVQNGMSVYSLHHRAFDRHFVAVTPELCIQVRPDLLDESNGPSEENSHTKIR